MNLAFVFIKFVFYFCLYEPCICLYIVIVLNFSFYFCRKKLDFSEALKRLESDSECQGLPMISFLLLPMQRITRLPLLVDAICHRMDPISDKNRHTSAIKALDALNKVTPLVKH